MKKLGLTLALLSVPAIASATPSTDIWTPATTYIQPFAVPHITYDSYFNGNKDYPTDLGVTVGVLPLDKIQAEVGVDVLAPVLGGGNQTYFNGKMGTPENALFDGMPGITAGVMSVGMQSEDKKTGSAGTMYNIIHAEVGKTLPYVGTLALGGYTGNKKLLLDEKGKADNSGFMASWYRPLTELTDVVGVGVDYMSGDNLYGALGAGVTIFPTPAAGIILGIVNFNSDTGTGSKDHMLYTAQADVDVDIVSWFKSKEPAASDAAPAPAEAAPAPVTPAP